LDKKPDLVVIEIDLRIVTIGFLIVAILLTLAFR
jgi:hypothetical protein